MSMKKPKTINPDEVDPSVYYYDEVYDEMTEERDHKRIEDKGSRKAQESKYIQGIKETAEVRKAEKELRKFKKFTQDRRDAEAEGRLDGEEVFITSTYKKKLESMEKLEEEKLKMLESEKSLAMNFTRRSSQSKTREDPKVNQLTTTQCEVNHSEDRPKSPIDEENLEDSQQSEKPVKVEKKKRLRTVEDRRRYLKEILAKRTIGRRYKEAVMRFKLRKVS